LTKNDAAAILDEVGTPFQQMGIDYGQPTFNRCVVSFSATPSTPNAERGPRYEGVRRRRSDPLDTASKRRG